MGINDCLRAIIGDDCKIKWPNDIYYKDEKLGGVLIENITAGTALKASIIGIGINVNQKNYSGANIRATSLSKILHQDYDLNQLLKQLCKSIESRYLQLKTGDLVGLNRDYLDRLYRLNVVHSFLIGDKTCKGIIKGVSDEGFLLLQIDDELRSFGLKQVAFIFD